MDVMVPLVIIGDAAYPLLPWLMKGFQDSGELTIEQQHLNSILSSARMVVEGALGRLKNRVRCLLKRNDTTLKYLPVKIAACCVLHNICETRGDDLGEECASGILADDDPDNESITSNVTQADSTAQEIRHALSVLIIEQL